jgi:hypothetical protein
MKWRVNVLALAALMLGSCASTHEFDGSMMLGMVYNMDRLPVADVSVSVLNGGQVVGKTLTDIHGRFNIAGVPHGPVTVQFSKDSYEPVSWTLRFQGPSQVVYMRLENTDELLAEAGDAIEKRSWASALGLLDRVDKLVPHSKLTVYMRGIILSNQGKPADAAKLLEGLSTDGTASFAVELTLADLYQYKLNDSAQALTHLKRAQTLKKDIDVDKRVADLSAETPAP